VRIDYWLTDIHTGQLLGKIDIGNTSWSMTVNDNALATVHDKKVGQDDVQDIDVPWSEIPGETQHEKYEAIEPNRRAIAAFLVNDNDERSGSIGTPFIWGGIVNKKDDWESVSLSIGSVYSMLADRFVVYEGQFQYPRSKNQISFSRMTMRGLESEVGRICTDMKPGGMLPVDWTYLGEQHRRVGNEDNNLHARNYWAWNVSNLSGKDVFDKLAGVRDGVDSQWRPYLTRDGHHVRLRFVAGTDEERYLGQSDSPVTFSCFPGGTGGNLQKVHVDYAQAVNRWYGTGAGEDAETLTYMAEDLTLVNKLMDYALVEKSLSDTDASNPDVLRGEVDGKLEAWRYPLMQLSGEFDMADDDTPLLGRIWPGEVCYVNLYEYPDLPNGKYAMRVMELSGDSSTTVKVVFDAQKVPYFD
jgi:hypothetical protein